MSDQQLDCALDLMRRLPPQQIEKNLSDLIDLVPSLCEDLLSSVDQPLKIARDKVVGKDYLLCDYNRDGDSYRSPWSNKYDPPLEDGAMPSARLRKLEVEANNAFDQYRDLGCLARFPQYARAQRAHSLDKTTAAVWSRRPGPRAMRGRRRYFEGGVSSVYLWDLDHGFAGVILIKKAGDGSKKIKGCWDSIHVVEVQEKSSGRTAHYKLTSTVMLWLQTNKSGSGTMNLGGSLTRQMEKDETVSDCSPHIANIGRLVEDMENKIRSTLNEIYFGKTKDIVNGLRSVDVIPDHPKFQQLQRELSQVLTQRQIHIQPDN
ncbi:F-actin-capping protein subunit beta isoform X6 [Prionailurus iriomotensis]